MPHYPDEIEYSDKYVDSHYEYRHVILPKEIYKKLPKGRLLGETVSQSTILIGMERHRGAAVSRVGPLRDPQARAPYSAVP